MSTEEQTIPKGYKRTEVGVIPSDWEVKRLRDVGEIITGSTPPTQIKEYWNGLIPWITPTDISNKKDIYNSEREISFLGLQVIRKLPANTLLVTCIASIGKNAILRADGACNQQINAIIPSNDYNVDFLYYLIENSKQYLLGSAGITATLMISKKDFSEITFSIPNNPEQTAIATALSDTDALIEKLTNLIEKKKNIKQGTMQELLTGKRRLPGFSGEWEVKKIGQLGRSYGGLTGKIKSDFGIGNNFYIPFMNIMSNPVIDPSYFDIVNIRVDETQHMVQKGDLFFNGSSETPEEVGMCSVLLENIPNLYLNSFCFGFRLNEDLNTSGLFFAYYFRSNVGRKLIYSLAQGAIRYNLSKTNFLKLDIPYPRPEEQTAIATVLSDIDAEIEKLESQLSKCQNLKQGMMQTLLTGKIRLI